MMHGQKTIKLSITGLREGMRHLTGQNRTENDMVNTKTRLIGGNKLLSEEIEWKKNKFSWN
jgi:hypothetical protein